MMIVFCSIARCIIFGVPRLPVRPCDERPPAMYGHFCLVPRVSVHDRYYCILLYEKCGIILCSYPYNMIDSVEQFGLILMYTK